MKKINYLLLTLLFSFFSHILQAQTLVLVQGYLGDADIWRISGVSSELSKAGWVDAGNLKWYQGKVINKGYNDGKNRFYTVSLPTEASLSVQLRFLAQYLAAVQKVHPDEALILVGHSAGGVLARYYMVQYPNVHIKALITISSPHLGTELAELGSFVNQTPMGWMAPLVGAGSLNRSQNLFNELSREKPQNFLYWLNHQNHPVSQYISVIRASNHGLSGDMVVPSWSQDMNNVYQLRGRSKRLITDADHSLNASDGALLAKIMKELSLVTKI